MRDRHGYREFQGLYKQLTNSMGPMQTPAGAKHGPGGRSRLSADRVDVLLSAVEKPKGRASFRSLGPA